MDLDYERCIECGRCTDNCVFLKKYDINLKDYSSLKDLAFNCYLCDRCKEVCPVDISGARLSLDLRQASIEEGYNLSENGYKMLVKEKKDYIFKNYKKVSSKQVFFPGCNFPAYFPKATKKVIQVLKNDFGISTIFDCCGKPMADLRSKDELFVKENLIKRLKDHGVEELILICPNCYYYLKENSDIRVSMIYEKEEIMESLLVDKASKREGKLFIPCPDRKTREIYDQLTRYTQAFEFTEIEDIQCCGAGGCAGIKEKDLSKKLQDDFLKYGEEIFVYCATCAGMITKSNENVNHLFCKLIGSEEKISKGINTVKNRALFSILK